MSRVGEVNEVPERAGEFEWRIPNFSTLLEKSDGWYCSPLISFADESWGMVIHPNGQRQSNSAGYIDLDFGRLSVGPAVSLKLSFWLKTVSGNKEFQRNFSHVYQHTYEKKEISKILSRTDLLKRKYDLLPSGVLTVVCSLECIDSEKDSCHTISERCPNCKETFDAANISSHKKKCIARPIKCPECTHVIPLQNWYDHDCTSAGIKGETAGVKCPYCNVTLEALCLSSNEKSSMDDEPIKCLEMSGTKELCEHECLIARAEALQKLLKDLKQMLLLGAHSDVTVKVKTEEFQLHRCILRARNPYFDSTEFNEGDVSFLCDNETEPEHFRSLIHYIYTGTADKLSSENACSLYKVAHKYRENHLKAECLHIMMNSMSVDNFCQFIALAIQYGEQKLLEKASEMFTSKAKEIMRNPKWNFFVEEYPAHANELFMKTLE